MVPASGSGMFPHVQQHFDQQGIDVFHDRFKEQTQARLIEVEIDCLSRVPAMLHKRKLRGESVLPCLMLFDIDGTMINDPPLGMVPRKTAESVNWCLNQRDIRVLAVTSRDKKIAERTEGNLSSAGIQLVSDSNPRWLDDKSKEVKSGFIYQWQKDALLIQNNIIYTTGEDKGTFVKQIIKVAEQALGQPFGSIVFVDNTHSQYVHVANMLWNTDFEHKGNRQIQYSCFFRPSGHSSTKCSCELPAPLSEVQAVPQPVWPERSKSLSTKRHDNSEDRMIRERKKQPRPQPQEPRRRHCTIL